MGVDIYITKKSGKHDYIFSGGRGTYANICDILLYYGIPMMCVDGGSKWEYTFTAQDARMIRRWAVCARLKMWFDRRITFWRIGEIFGGAFGLGMPITLDEKEYLKDAKRLYKRTVKVVGIYLRIREGDTVNYDY